MPLPILGILAIGGAYLATGAASPGSDTVSEPSPDDDSAPPDEQSVPTPSTESPTWDPLLEELRGDVPLDFLQRWIVRESAGNPCSVGSPAQLQRDGYAREAGIGQLYFESAEAKSFGVRSADLRSACSTTSQSLVRELTDDEMRTQVNSLVAMAASYIATSQSRLDAAGCSWEQDDVLALAKLQHALPVLGKSFLPAASSAGQAESWIAFRAYVLGLSVSDLGSIDHGVVPYASSLSRLFANASYTAGLE